MARLQPRDLLHPRGRLKPKVVFPGQPIDDVTTSLTNFLNDGYALGASLAPEATQNAAVRAYAYYRAYDEFLEEYASRPLSMSLPDEGSISRNIEQVRLFRELRDQYLSEWETAVPPATPSALRQRNPSGYAVNRQVI